MCTNTKFSIHSNINFAYVHLKKTGKGREKNRKTKTQNRKRTEKGKRKKNKTEREPKKTEEKKKTKTEKPKKKRLTRGRRSPPPTRATRVQLCRGVRARLVAD
jgi:hypothetical protein